jgi:HPt (histidine-containing phosphotransfer) domain-containing protein
MTKPFTQDQLAALLRKWAGPKRDDSRDSDSRIELDRGPLENLRMLEKQGGRIGIVEKVIRLYLESSPGLIREIEQAMSSGDCKRLHHAAHSLKTSSANVGGTAFAELCKQAEMMGRQESLAGADELLPRLMTSHDALRRALERELERARRVTVSS